MTQFIIHVGPHKTGTTYLQECFAQCRAPLAGRGIHFPSVWGATAHHALYEALTQVPNPALAAQFAALHAGRHARVLISVEGLGGLPEPAIGYLARLIGPGHGVRCIYYVRSWGELLPSHWRESVKGGQTETLPEYLYRRTHNATVAHFLNFAIPLRNWRTHFGADAVRLVAYNHVAAQQRDLFRHFAEAFLDWPDPPKLEVTPANLSLSAEDSETVRAVAALERLRTGAALPSRYAGALARHYVHGKAKLVTPRIAQALAAHRGSINLNELIPPLMELQRSLLAEFGNALVAPRLPNFLFRPRRHVVPYVQSDWLLAPGVLEDMRAMQQALRAAAEAGGHSAPPR